MIEKDPDFDHFAVNCDECPASVEIEKEDWRSMIDALKALGWRTFKDSAGDWTHVCPACVQAWKEGQRDA